MTDVVAWARMQATLAEREKRAPDTVGWLIERIKSEHKVRARGISIRRSLGYIISGHVIWGGNFVEMRLPMRCHIVAEL
jgi:hypothetical protein